MTDLCCFICFFFMRLHSFALLSCCSQFRNPSRYRSEVNYFCFAVLVWSNWYHWMHFLGIKNCPLSIFINWGSACFKLWFTVRLLCSIWVFSVSFRILSKSCTETSLQCDFMLFYALLVLLFRPIWPIWFQADNWDFLPGDFRLYPESFSFNFIFPESQFKSFLLLITVISGLTGF